MTNIWTYNQEKGGYIFNKNITGRERGNDKKNQVEKKIYQHGKKKL
jgi:hypothetical protein